MKKCLFLDYQKSDKAAENRLSLVMQGFKENNFSVDYIYIVKNKYIYIYDILKQIIRYFRLLSKMDKGDILYVYGEIHLPFLLLYAKRKGVRIFTERTEYPFEIIFPEKVSYKTKTLSYLYRKSLKKMDLFIVGTYALKEYYQRFAAEETQFLVIPFLIDLTKFQDGINIKKENIITYCGYMGSNNKDGVENIIDVFCKSEYAYKNFNLILIGDAAPDEFQKLKEIVAQRDSNKKIIFTGRLKEHQEVINYLMKSKLHILAKPNTKRNKGAFPSKIAEYLATSTPSILTNVGDVSIYLRDNESIFLVEPDDNMKFSERLTDVLKNKELMSKVGKKGREVVEEYTPKKQIKKILEFANFEKQ